MCEDKDCNCGCDNTNCDSGNCDCTNNNEEFGKDTVTLLLDDGREMECAIFKIFPAGKYEYIALLPTDCEEEESGEVFLYRFELNEKNEPHLSNIQDDDEYEIVAEAFDEILDSLEFDELCDNDEEE